MEPKVKKGVKGRGREGRVGGWEGVISGRSPLVPSWDKTSYVVTLLFGGVQLFKSTFERWYQ